MGSWRFHRGSPVWAVYLGVVTLIFAAAMYVEFGTGDARPQGAYVGRWASDAEVLELGTDGRLGAVRMYGDFCGESGRRESGELRSFRGSWRTASVDDAGSGVLVDFEDYSPGRSCEIYLQADGDGPVFRLLTSPRPGEIREFAR
ncbi:hypothetical protein ACIGZJ_06045 [Kitasatospora sp. NPDC052868]|uniref:hypothetical protein n=1 Tax=Kitasatospora sp. NPDC052868 TaxID=3364060 RepID=UPI0037C86CDF